MARSRGRRRRDGRAYYAVIDEDELERLAGDGGAGAIAVLVALRVLADGEGVVEGLTARRIREITALGRDGIRAAIDALVGAGMVRTDSSPGAAPTFWLTRTAADVIGKATPAANHPTPGGKPAHPRRKTTAPQAANHPTPGGKPPDRVPYKESDKDDESAAPTATAEADRGAGVGEAADEALPPFSEIFRKGREALGAMKHAEPLEGDELAARRAEIARQRAEGEAELAARGAA